MLYHASRQRFDEPRGLFCVTDDADAAIGYLYGEAGYLYTVELTRWPETATEDDVRALCEELGIDYYGEGGNPWAVVEGYEALRRALRLEGYEAVEFTDLGPDNAYEHWTLMLLDPSLARIVGVEAVSAEVMA